MIMFRADLHCHSTFSDGTLSSHELVDLAIANGLTGLSITDHDTTDAYPEVLSYAAGKGVAMIPGIEFSAMHKGTSVHVLGYAFSLSEQAIPSLCKRHQERREKRYHKILEKLAAQGMPIDEIEEPIASIGRPHIATAMIQKGYVQSVEEAFKKYLSEGRPCFIPGEAFSVEESLDAIHASKGLAVIAHPHLIQKTSLVKDLLSMPFDGLEGYYALFFPKQEERWVKIANHKNWLLTGGSDFHGSIKPKIPLGCSWVGEETFNILQRHFKQHDLRNTAT